MKKIVLLVLFVAIIGGSLFAQAAAPTTTISGTLGLSAGRISVVSGNTTYYVRGLERYVGFINGLNYGAAVSLTGYAAPPTTEGQTDRLFRPVTLTMGGRNYEVGSPAISNRTPGRDGRFAGPRSMKR